jgi:NADPH:quinone reductase-like Zn-dependent oxidoreductase
MKIAILQAPREFVVVDEPLPAIGDDEVLVRVAYCGVCTSELDVWAGVAGGLTFPRFPGHEVSGVVEKVGDRVDALKLGDRVGVWVAGRGFAEYVAVKAEHCLPAGDVPLDLALAEPLACAVNTVDLARVALGDDVVIIGAGFMGNLVQQLVELRGPRHVIVADTRNDTLERARQLGATEVVNVATESLPEVVKRLTGGRGADISFEWDEARHIEIVAKACEDEFGATLGYGPWPLIWWWMQNEADPLKRIAVTNSWSEANLMNMLRQWRLNAEKRGYTRVAELCDYLQADELTHVKLATRWIRKLTEDDPERRDELVQWGRAAVARIERFYSDNPDLPERDVHFTFLKPDDADVVVAAPVEIIGE